MPTFSQPVVNRQIIIYVALATGPSAERRFFKALVDTGAQNTAISPNVVGELGLLPTGATQVTVASGQTMDVFEYRAVVDIPVGYTLREPQGESTSFYMGDELLVTGLPYNPTAYDVLLGMDLLGKFHLTLYNDTIILSN